MRNLSGKISNLDRAVCGLRLCLCESCLYGQGLSLGCLGSPVVRLTRPSSLHVRRRFPSRRSSDRPPGLHPHFCPKLRSASRPAGTGVPSKRFRVQVSDCIPYFVNRLLLRALFPSSLVSDSKFPSTDFSFLSFPLSFFSCSRFLSD